MNIHVNPMTILKVSLISIVTLIVLHIVANMLVYTVPMPTGVYLVTQLFNMDQEISLPTWFAQNFLLLAGAVALLIGLARRKKKAPFYRYWLGIAALLIYMSADEGASIHELASEPLMNLLGTEGTILHFGWIVAGVAAVGLVVAIYYRFWRQLPGNVRWLFAAAAMTYVAGAIGVELIGGYYGSNIGYDFPYTLIVAVEESLEMIGASIATYAFLRYQQTQEPLIFSIGKKHS